MNPRETLNDLISSKGVEGRIAIDSSMFYQEVNSAMRDFEGRFEEFNYINFFLFFDSELPFETDLVAGSWYSELAGSVVFFDIDNLIKQLKENDIFKVSRVFVKRFVFGCLLHESYHCREGGKFLLKLQNRKPEEILPHDEDPEEIEADLFAIKRLKEIE
jgi:hypothetical protein